jgi:NADPH-dependent curcumin reductase CurA
MKKFGKIAICGSISTYDRTDNLPPGKEFVQTITGKGRLDKGKDQR